MGGFSTDIGPTSDINIGSSLNRNIVFLFCFNSHKQKNIFFFCVFSEHDLGKHFVANISLQLLGLNKNVQLSGNFLPPTVHCCLLKAAL